jgi:hypothetical protein
VINKLLIPTPSKIQEFFWVLHSFFDRSKCWDLYLHIGAERCVILHQRVEEMEQLRDAHWASLHIPLLFPHGELGWHLAVLYQLCGGTVLEEVLDLSSDRLLNE